MIRKLITIGLPLLTPFVVYFVWWWAAKRKELADAQGRKLPAWQELPWAWLISSGTLLLAATLILSVIFGSDARDGVYHTPQYKDGVVVPGRIER